MDFPSGLSANLSNKDGGKLLPVNDAGYAADQGPLFLGWLDLVFIPISDLSHQH